MRDLDNLSDDDINNLTNEELIKIIKNIEIPDGLEIKPELDLNDVEMLEDGLCRLLVKTKDGMERLKIIKLLRKIKGTDE